MTDIYDQHKHAFPSVSAYVIARNGERVATIAFKYPRDGAQRLYAYVHWLGTEMVRGYAGGYGYDKHSAACAAATAYAARTQNAADSPEDPRACFWRALERDRGYRWDRELSNYGFEVWQAV